MSSEPSSTTDLPQFEECDSLALRQAARAIGQLYDRHLAQAGLRGGQYSLLAHLERLQPVGLNALAQVAGMDRTTLNRVLQPLERDGFVRTDPSPTDRRSRVLSLTPEGLAKRREGRGPWEAAQAAFETTFGVAEAAQLRVLLRPLRPLPEDRAAEY